MAGGDHILEGLVRQSLRPSPSLRFVPCEPGYNLNIRRQLEEMFPALSRKHRQCPDVRDVSDPGEADEEHGVRQMPVGVVVDVEDESLDGLPWICGVGVRGDQNQ